jgi:hypothetical protein
MRTCNTRSLRRDSLLREVEGSRERLGVQTIDLYQIYWPVPEEEIEEGWSTLAELKERGVVRPEQGRSDRGGGEPHAGQARHRHAPSEEVISGGSFHLSPRMRFARSSL